MLNSTELKQLEADRQQARVEAIQISKRFKIIKKVYFETQGIYKDKINQYNKLDHVYAHELFNLKQNAKQAAKRAAKAKPYNSAKRMAEKALKALESLPKELRDQIIKNAQNELF